MEGDRMNATPRPTHIHFSRLLSLFIVSAGTGIFHLIIITIPASVISSTLSLSLSSSSSPSCAHSYLALQYISPFCV